MTSQLLLLAQSSDAAGAGGLFAGMGIFMLLLVLLGTVFWIWMLIDCLTNRSLEGMQKVIWLLVIFFLSLLGAVIYFFVGRSGRTVTV